MGAIFSIFAGVYYWWAKLCLRMPFITSCMLMRNIHLIVEKLFLVILSVCYKILSSLPFINNGKFFRTKKSVSHSFKYQPLLLRSPHNRSRGTISINEINTYTLIRLQRYLKTVDMLI